MVAQFGEFFIKRFGNSNSEIYFYVENINSEEDLVCHIGWLDESEGKTKFLEDRNRGKFVSERGKSLDHPSKRLLEVIETTWNQWDKTKKNMIIHVLQQSVYY